MLAITAMAEIGNHVGTEPWPSLEWASWIFDRASWVLVVSLAIGLSATVVIVWMGIVKEHHWDLARESAATKTAGLELEAAKANAEVAKAQAEIAKTNLEIEQTRKRAEQTRDNLGLLHRRVTARAINEPLLIRAIKAADKAVVDIVYLRDGVDCFVFASKLRQAIQQGGWTVRTFKAIPSIEDHENNPDAIGGNAYGVSVVGPRTDLETDMDGADWIARGQTVNRPVSIIGAHILKVLHALAWGGDERLKFGEVRIIIAPPAF